MKNGTGNIPVLVIVISAIMLILCSSAVHAYEIRSVFIVGRTVDIDLSGELPRGPGEISDEGIRDLAVKITNAYHWRGYRAAFIEKITVRKDGVLEIRIHESVVQSVFLEAPDDGLWPEIQSIFSVLEGEVYNELRMNKLLSSVKERFRLTSLTARTERNRNRDIILFVFAGARQGDLYGGIGVDFAYGIRPLIGYYRPFGRNAADMKISAGIREGELSRAGGDITMYRFSVNRTSAWYLRLGASRVTDLWQILDEEYTVLSVRPVVGIRYFRGMALYDLSLSEKAGRVQGYRGKNSGFSDTGVTAAVHFNNRRRKLDERETGDLRFSVSAGWEDFTGSGYASSSLRARVGIIPFYSMDWLCFIPRVAVSFTTSGERLFREYVYDSSFIVASNDYSASSWKNVAGLVCEAAVGDSGFFAGPFINTGYYLDERDDWVLRTGTGIRGRVMLKDVRIEIYYAWDVPGDPYAGGFIVMAEGTF